MPGEEEAKTLQSIAANLRRLRTRRELTQERLAELASVDIRFIQKLESGKVNPSATTLVALAAALETKIAALFRPAQLQPANVGRPAVKRSTKRR